MTSLVRPTIRNTRRDSRIKFREFIRPSHDSGRNIPGHPSNVIQVFLAFGIFTPVGVFSVKGDGFHKQRGIQPFVRSNSRFSRLRRSYINE